MGIPDDANPLNRCLPAEVVTRMAEQGVLEHLSWVSRQKKQKKEEKEDMFDMFGSFGQG